MDFDQLQTMRRTFEEICQGQDPWIALGNFMNDWYAYHSDRRPELVADALPDVAMYPEEMHQWAVFCVASIEWFCHRYAVSCPSWIDSSLYTLSNPWFTRDQASVQSWLLTTTPEEFRSRNIFCGNRMFLNKYEFA